MMRLADRAWLRTTEEDLAGWIAERDPRDAQDHAAATRLGAIAARVGDAPGG